jgi:hypothetical protein
MVNPYIPKEGIVMEEKEVHLQEKRGTDEEKLWYGITHLGNGFGLFKFQFPYVDAPSFSGTWRNAKSFLEHIVCDFEYMLRSGQAELQGMYPTRGNIDTFIKEFISNLALSNYGPDLCRAIIDFSRTSLPQLSGQGARDAFAMGSYLSHWENNYGVYLGYHDELLVYNGQQWRKPKDLGDIYYEILRRKHPLVIYWNVPNSGLGMKIHPDYAPRPIS